jgi:regulator of protease activity HflC (stomatin/prohibitin superfamily)
MSVKAIVAIAVGLVLISFLILVNPFVVVTAGHRGVVMNWGAVSQEIMGEGLHWRTPIVQSVQIMDVQIQKEEVAASAASKDLQELNAVVALNYHIDPSKVNILYQSIGMDFTKRIIDPAIQEAVKASTAKFTAEEVITKRAAVKEDIKEALTIRLAREYIIVDEVSIKEFDFSKSFNDAIEAKVTAEQQALQAKNVLERVKFEAEQRIAQATAEAEAIRIQADSISKQGGDNYVQMKAIEKWNGVLPVQMIPNATVPFIKLETSK